MSLIISYSPIKSHKDGSSPEKIIIGYKREAFFYKQNAFRVTFDYNVKKSYNTKEFLNSNLQMQNISFENNCIIEVKYNQILPFLFKQILNSISTKRTAYSKYYNCRKIN